MCCLQSYNGFRIDTVLLAKSDSGVMFCLQSYQRHIIDRLNINTKVIYRFALTQVECKSYIYLAIVNKILHHCHSLLAEQ